MTIPAQSALKAFEHVINGYSEENAWKKAIYEVTDSSSTRFKCCPKIAFCGIILQKVY